MPARRRSELEALIKIAEQWAAHPLLEHEIIDRLLNAVREGCVSAGTVALIPEVARVGFLARFVERPDHGRTVEIVGEVRTLCKSLSELDNLDPEKIISSAWSAEAILRQDPSGNYTQMDARTRAYYREQVDLICDATGRTSAEIARLVLNLALEHGSGCQKEGDCHIGRWLLGDMRACLAEALREERLPTLPGTEQPLGTGLWWRLVASTAGFAGALVVCALEYAAMPVAALPVMLLATFPIIYEAISVSSQRLASALKFPRPSFAMSLQDGITSDSATVIAVPMLLADYGRFAVVVARLVSLARCCGSEPVQFTILTDFVDSRTEGETQAEINLLEAAIQLIQETNLSLGKARLSLLHRHRTYSPREGCWYGLERKSGKIGALIKWIRQKGPSFDVAAGDFEALQRSRFLVMFDEDGTTSMESIRSLVAAMAHPFNAARIDPKGVKVLSGYGAMAPALTLSEHEVDRSARRSSRPRIVPDQSGRDLFYSLWAEVPMTGKAIIDISVADQVLINRLPAEIVLSHDYVEGALLRTGYVPLARVEEGRPRGLVAESERHHRWARGDWQNVLILLVSLFTRSSSRIAFPRVEVFMIWAVLRVGRRTVLPLAFFTIILCFVTYPKSNPLIPGLLLLLPVLMESALLVAGRVLRMVGWDRGASPALPIGVLLIFLRGYAISILHIPQRAMLMLDAIVTSTWRVANGKRCLEWTASSQIEIDPHRAFQARKSIRVGLLTSLSVFLGSLIVNGDLPSVMVITGLWLLAALAQAKQLR